MIRFDEIKDKDIVRGILNIPPLKETTTGYKDLEIVLEPDPTITYIGGWENSELICMYPIKILTNQMVEIHIYTLPKYWGTGKAKTVSKAIMEHLDKNTSYKILYSTAPEKNNLGNKFLSNLQFKKQCTIDNGVDYLGELMGLNIYTYTFAEDKTWAEH